MRSRSIEVYLLPSLIQLVEADELVLIDEPGRRVVLTASPDEARRHLQIREAAGILFASRFMAGLPGATDRERFDAALAGVTARPSPPVEGLFVVTDCERDITDAEMQHIIDLGDIAISLGSGSDASWREGNRAARNSALSALSLSTFDGVTNDGRTIGTVDILYETETQRPVYDVTITGSATFSSKSTLTPEQATEAAKLARALTRAPKNLRHVPRLLAQSHEERLKPLSSFISAWTGLEILVVTGFEQHETSFAETLKGALPTSASTVAGRVRTIMKDKYRLADKFALMAGSLDPEGADEDVAKFLELKEVRDSFFHTFAVAIESLPSDATRQLLRKYLKLHLESAA